MTQHKMAVAAGGNKSREFRNFTIFALTRVHTGEVKNKIQNGDSKRNHVLILIRGFVVFFFSTIGLGTRIINC
ncbi:hypothetical protein PV327_003273 [Microctonus hyperodae]|uniref:Uncharacterized protein n=1 Tax=Microctonus hyperodae TaxID=165561 RepID=A0AA39G3P5_MICHY|nr:hypothetical protein PV327_003273 [Microctonus hyperodae]